MKSHAPCQWFSRKAEALGLVLLFLLHGCGFPVSHVDGQLNVLHPPEFTIESIGLLDKNSLNQQTVVTLKVREKWPNSKKRGPIAKGIVEGAGKGVSVGWEICVHEREEKTSYQGANDKDYSLAGELIGRLIVCPLLILS